MSKLLDLKSQVFGRLTAIKRAPDHRTSGGNIRVVWLCVCKCGKEIKVSVNSLTQGKTKSCGCLAIERAIELGKLNKAHGGYSESSSYETRVKHQALVNIKERARRRGYESDLEISDLPALTSECPVLGIKYNRGSLKDKNASPSVDRKNSNLPYLKEYKDNLVFISHRANRIKSDASPEEIRKVLKYIESQGTQNGGQQ